MRMKVFVACALGGGIGALVALQVWSALWWIGLLVGGLVGYLSYEFKEVLRAVPRAWERAKSEELRVGVVTVLRRSWFGIKVGVAFTVISSNLWPIVLLLYASGLELKTALLIYFSALAMVSLLMAVISAREIDTKEAQKEALPVFTNFSKRLNPLIVYGYYLPRGIWWTMKRIPTGLKFLFLGLCWSIMLLIKFFKHLFLLIHSEIRLLCAVDAALGAMIGFFAGSVLIGALAGGVIGVLNFELISKRILHLVPSR